MGPESCAFAPASLKISKRYLNCGEPWPNFSVAAVTVSVGVSLTCWSLIGETGAGAVALSVDPSAAVASIAGCCAVALGAPGAD